MNFLIIFMFMDISLCLPTVCINMHVIQLNVGHGLMQMTSTYLVSSLCDFLTQSFILKYGVSNFTFFFSDAAGDTIDLGKLLTRSQINWPLIKQQIFCSFGLRILTLKKKVLLPNTPSLRKYDKPIAVLLILPESSKIMSLFKYVLIYWPPFDGFISCQQIRDTYFGEAGHARF